MTMKLHLTWSSFKPLSCWTDVKEKSCLYTSMKDNNNVVRYLSGRELCWTGQDDAKLIMKMPWKIIKITCTWSLMEPKKNYENHEQVEFLMPIEYKKRPWSIRKQEWGSTIHKIGIVPVTIQVTNCYEKTYPLSNTSSVMWVSQKSRICRTQ